MLIRAGFDIRVATEVAVPIIVALSPYPDHVEPIEGSTEVRSNPPVPMTTYHDSFGNRIGRLVAPAGGIGLFGDFIVRDSGRPDPFAPWAAEHPVADLPDETLLFLLPSRYVESDTLVNEAWNLFGSMAPGWGRVQAICAWVNGHIRFGYEFGRPTKTALEAYREGTGVCRDFAHLAIAMCRALNIPARYASGYLGDIGVPEGGPMDFSAWIEVFIGNRWYTFDPRNNGSMPRIGRILIVRGRDAADAAMITSFGIHTITHFEVWTDEVRADIPPDQLRRALRDGPTIVGESGQHRSANGQMQGGRGWAS